MFVSIGQGGNQLSACWWQRAAQQRQQHLQTHSKSKSRTNYTGAAATNTAAASFSSSSSAPRPLLPPPVSPYFALDGYARGIFLDAEPKVVDKLQQMGERMHGAMTTETTKTQQRRANQTQGSAAHASASGANIAASSSAVAPATSLFRPSNFFSEQYGRGNNWAMGYMGRMGDEGAEGSLLSDTLDAIRRESERMDTFDSVVLMHSLAGGTGSGLGSRITEEIRHNYQKQFILSVCIAPFGIGDTPLQHYNSLLALSHLYPIVDGLVLASNADIARALTAPSAQKQANSSQQSDAPIMAFAGINTYLSACLADVIAPTKLTPSLQQLDRAERGLATSPVQISSNASSSCPLLATPSLHELITHVSPLPAYKLLEIWSSAGLGASGGETRYGASKPSWKGCLDSLKRFIPRDTDMLASNLPTSDDQLSSSPSSYTLSYSVFARGDTAEEPFRNFQDTLQSKINRLLPPVDWNPFPADIITTHLPRMTWRPFQSISVNSANSTSSSRQPSTESDRSIAVCVNRTRTARQLQPVIGKARDLLLNKAYVHWYTRYGVEPSELSESIDGVEQIVCDYESLNLTNGA